MGIPLSPSTVCALPSRDIIIKTKFFVHINKKCYQGRSAMEKPCWTESNLEE